MSTTSSPSSNQEVYPCSCATLMGEHFFKRLIHSQLEINFWNPPEKRFPGMVTDSTLITALQNLHAQLYMHAHTLSHTHRERESTLQKCAQ
ncbi:hypothetical protein AALO_G00173810 [Alosa alosa]|uniref:Uncharacterized protein n=1 Tax=Alosa alosa TaxID=278164 RepID=A0AAV6G772_9TELE|nr:hypothetical protein AALO_G00173810 [Alosa alosa]